MSVTSLKEPNRAERWRPKRGALLRTGTADTSRVEASSDGVHAIVITLVVLEIKVPEAVPNDEAALWHALRASCP